MYGLKAITEILDKLNNESPDDPNHPRLNAAERQMIEHRIANLEDSHAEFDPDTLIYAVFIGVNRPAYDFACSFDHSHLRYGRPARP